jgi:uncharacterized membrane protein (DUF441 family)
MTSENLTDAQKEQIKLRATFLNNIGIGVMLIGVFTPIVRAMYEPAVLSGSLVSIIATMVICFSFGVALHLMGGLILMRLNR